MKNLSTHIKTASQQSPIFGRTDMVKNNAGGFVFSANDQEKLERFLLIGSENGTYYVKEQQLTVENAEHVLAMIKHDAVRVAETVIDFLSKKRAPKVDASLFVLALVASYGSPVAKAMVYQAIPTICQTTTQLFLLASNLKGMRGWSRGLRNAFAKFYTEKSNDKLAYQLVKYRNRAGYTHKDIITLSHPSTKDALKNDLLKYAINKLDGDKVEHSLIKAFTKASTTTDVKELLVLIQEGLSWEMVPTNFLNDKKVLTALLPNMPIVALIRNLNRFSINGMTDMNNDVVKSIVTKLTTPELVSKLHSISVVNALLAYSSGTSQHGHGEAKTWTPNQNIVDALNTTYELCLKNVVPTNKKILIGVDVSGSMSSQVGGMSMSASQIANVLAVSILKTEPNAELVWFDDSIKKPTIGRRSSVDEVLRHSPNGGGTDCSLPIGLALSQGLSFDSIIILTDSETWAGREHGLTVLNRYRKQVNKDVKIVEVAMVSNPYTTLPDDKNLLRVVGFDSTVTEIINKFLEK